MRGFRPKLTTVVLALAGLGAVAITAAPAGASLQAQREQTCTAFGGGPDGFGALCHTEFVAAACGGGIEVRIDSGDLRPGGWRVFDYETGAIIGDGNVFAGTGQRIRIAGLHGKKYYLAVKGYNATGHIWGG